jgi:hypothetical protein
MTCRIEVRPSSCVGTAATKATEMPLLDPLSSSMVRA